MYFILKMPHASSALFFPIALKAVKWFFICLFFFTIIVDRPKKKKNKEQSKCNGMPYFTVTLHLHIIDFTICRKIFRFPNDAYAQFLIDRMPENTLSSRSNNFVAKIYYRMHQIARFSCNCWLTILFTIRLLKYW